MGTLLIDAANLTRNTCDKIRYTREQLLDQLHDETFYKKRGKRWDLRSHPPGTLQSVPFLKTPLPLACLPQSRARAVSVQTVWVSSQHPSSDGVRRSLNRTRCRPTCPPNVASLHSHQHHLELAMSVSVRRVLPWIPHFCFIGVIAHRPSSARRRNSSLPRPCGFGRRFRRRAS